MLPKKKRISQKEVDEIFKIGKFLNSSTLSFRFIAGKSSSLSKISFIVPKSVAKLATARNYLRRRGYQALLPHLDKFPPGTLGVFLFKKNEKSLEVLEEEILEISKKLK